jgi:hypothetical protein
VNHRAGLDDLEKRNVLTLSGLELRPLSRPAHSQLIYRLRYPVCYSINNSESLKSNEVT